MAISNYNGCRRTFVVPKSIPRYECLTANKCGYSSLLHVHQLRIDEVGSQLNVAKSIVDETQLFVLLVFCAFSLS